MTGNDADLIIVGGGLAGGLTALAIHARDPDARIAIIERDGRVGGHHIWSFFDSDIDPQHRALMAPLVTMHWPGHDIRFPWRKRTIATGYNSICSEQLDQVVRARLGDAAIIPAAAVSLDAGSVVLSDQRRLTARAVIDARGGGNMGAIRGGWQKFVGWMIRTTAPHGVQRPVIMDATVEQHDGFRFVYLLPFAADRLLVEDTYYSDDPALDVATLGARIDAYIAAQGWRVASVERKEHGVLPVVSAGDPATLASSTDRADGVAVIGARAGLFQPVTSYSLPDAVRTAAAIAALWPCDGATLARAMEGHGADRWRAGRFGRLLNRMLFGAALPDERYRVLEHFYRLPQPVIERFYAGRLTVTDRLRILSGKPPVPVAAAIRALLEH